MQNLTPATDFYKKFALDCAAEQVAVDMFVLAGQYADLSTLSEFQTFLLLQVVFNVKLNVYSKVYFRCLAEVLTTVLIVTIL